MNSISPITVSIAEAARLIGIGRTSLYAAISTGKLAVRKSGRRTLVELEELHRFVTALPRNSNQLVACFADEVPPSLSDDTYA